MSIKPIDHYSMTNPASIYDEEAMTALELAGRTAVKVNEVVNDQNNLRGSVEIELENQNNKISSKFATQDEIIYRHFEDYDSKIATIKAETMSEQQMTDLNSLRNASVYMLNTHSPLKITSHDETSILGAGAVTIVFPSDGMGVIHNGEAVEIPFGDDRHLAPEQASSLFHHDGENWYINLAPYEALMMFKDSAYDSFYPCCKVYANESTSKDLLLLANGFGKIVGGVLADEHTRRFQETLSKQSIGFMGKDQKLSFSILPDNSGISVEFPCRMSVIHEQSLLIEWDQCSDEVSAKLSGTGNDRTLILPNHTALVFNYISNLLEFRPSGSIVYGDVVLLQNAWCNLIGGCLLVEWLAKNVDNGSGSSGGSSDAPVVQLPGVKEFSKIVASGSPNMKTMLFFTDPHLITPGEGWEENFQNYMKKVKEVADTASVDVVICGGDWLDAHNADDAKGHLSYIYGQMKAMFPNFIHTLGNHDTNYQGDEQLSQTAIDNLLFRESGKAYYDVTINGITYVVLDSGLDGKTGTALTEYEQEQLEWFRNLPNGEKVVILHGYWDNLGGDDFVTPLGQAITEIVSNFENTQEYLLVLSGHLHREKTELLYDADNMGEEGYHHVVSYAGKNLQNNGVPSMALIAVDNTMVDEDGKRGEDGSFGVVFVDIVNVETGEVKSYENYID